MDDRQRAPFRPLANHGYDVQGRPIHAGDEPRPAVRRCRRRAPIITPPVRPAHRPCGYAASRPKAQPTLAANGIWQARTRSSSRAIRFLLHRTSRGVMAINGSCLGAARGTGTCNPSRGSPIWTRDIMSGQRRIDPTGTGSKDVPEEHAHSCSAVHSPYRGSWPCPPRTASPRRPARRRSCAPRPRTDGSARGGAAACGPGAGDGPYAGHLPGRRDVRRRLQRCMSSTSTRRRWKACRLCLVINENRPVRLHTRTHRNHQSAWSRLAPSNRMVSTVRSTFATSARLTRPFARSCNLHDLPSREGGRSSARRPARMPADMTAEDEQHDHDPRRERAHGCQGRRDAARFRRQRA